MCPEGNIARLAVSGRGRFLFCQVGQGTATNLRMTNLKLIQRSGRCSELKGRVAQDAVSSPYASVLTEASTLEAIAEEYATGILGVE